jgi:hypothetical protein
MSLFEYLDKLRAKPEAERQRMVIWGTILITFIIFALWLLNLRYLWQNSQEPVPVVVSTATSTEAGGIGKAWQDAILRIKTGWQTITNQK